MARQKNDGRGRLGGRAKGTPNKTTASLRQWITNLVKKNKKQIESDLSLLDPKDYLLIMEKFMQYAMPKKQAVAASVDLTSLSDDQLGIVIDELLDRINDGEN
jgi:hypothetical protein